MVRHNYISVNGDQVFLAQKLQRIDNHFFLFGKIEQIFPLMNTGGPEIDFSELLRIRRALVDLLFHDNGRMDNRN